ncbi:hypothetical protein HanHA300_Chr04g0131351 [Helianthus annuus]|nr:hypothetical protein HanHA300_Chr04g0131351 [Helianthus annuus]KAJ0588241.1 hypothetical protein HanIR_Chr04g0172321 [Helianthus annuus]KAJ0596573.1 hypothetical protein HanHA89_Chr04g0144361 [Helianthus annuus]KAJ0757235.1 hypothetical protein HanLR1_Chr04g0136311 [Helianthus annuus]
MFAGIVMPHEDRDGCCMRQPIFIPGERMSIYCEDRSDLNQDLTKAIQWAHGKVVGGRTKVDMVVEWPQCQILGRSEFMGHRFTKSKLIELGRRLADSLGRSGGPV